MQPVHRFLRLVVVESGFVQKEVHVFDAFQLLHRARIAADNDLLLWAADDKGIRLLRVDGTYRLDAKLGFVDGGFGVNAEYLQIGANEVGHADVRHVAKVVPNVLEQRSNAQKVVRVLVRNGDVWYFIQELGAAKPLGYEQLLQNRLAAVYHHELVLQLQQITGDVVVLVRQRRAGAQRDQEGVGLSCVLHRDHAVVLRHIGCNERYAKLFDRKRDELH